MIGEKIASLNIYWKYLYPINWFQRSRVLNAICSTKELRENINRECVRADRYNQRYSLALFEVGTQNENSVEVRRLVRTLYSRFRNIDDLGWYSNRQIGVILPYTPTEGAWTLAEDVCALISSILEPPPFTIYTYPSEKWPGILQKKSRSFRNMFGWFQQFRDIRTISSSNKFSELIVLERERADRTNQIFSLVIFDMGLFETKGISANHLMRVIYRRKRITDELGLYDKQHFGFILPATSSENARKVTERYCNEAGITQSDFYTIYTYPDKWISSNKDDSTKQSLSDVSDEKDSSVLRDISSSSKTNVEGNITSAAEPIEKQTQTYKKTDREIEQFLVRPIPVWKRAMDIVGSLIGIVLLSPIFLLTAVLIKIVSQGPVFFKQARVGLGRKLFTFLKFRTMKVDSDTCAHRQYVRKLIIEDSDSKPMTKLDNDSRIIPFGKALRKTCIDELPQLVNVLRGEMSLVGPRPCLPYEADEYLRWHTRRFYSIPGMTGMWQVYGKNKTTFQEMIRLDIKYEKSRSLLLDIKILLMTPSAIISQIVDSSSKKRGNV